MKAEINIDLQGLAEEITAKVTKSLQQKLYHSKVETDSLLTVKTLAEYLQVSDQWVYQRVQLAELPVIFVGKFPRFKKLDIDKWLDSLKTPAMNPLTRSLKSI